MPIAAGQKLRASTLNLLQPKAYFAAATVDLPASSTNVDITGATVTFTTQSTNAVYMAHAVFDCSRTAGTANITGTLIVDGVTQTANAVLVGNSTVDRNTVAQNWSGTLAAAGSHTLKLNGTTGVTCSIRLTHTTIVVTVFEVV